MYDLFVIEINNAADKHIPFIKFCNKPVENFIPKQYWNPQLSKIVAQRRLALTAFRRNPTPENLTSLEKLTKESQDLIRKEKFLNWQKFCNSIDEATSASDLWRRMRWMKGFRQNKMYCSSKNQSELLSSLTPDYVTNIMPTFKSRNLTLEADFSMQELKSCLKKKDTAPGEDGISYSMIYHLPDTAQYFMLRLYNNIFKFGIIPTLWRNIQIIPIPKANSASNGEPKLRPISLLSCLAKIFHLLISRRLEWFVEKTKVLSPHTVGFRKSQSCLDSLTRLVSHIQIGFSKNIPTLACFLDIESAYNNVSIDVAMKILDNLQVGTKICTYLWSFLSERYLNIKSDTGETLLSRWTNKGLAQGDPLSPLLFNLVTHKICLCTQNILLSQYADDFVLFVSDKDIKSCEIRLQQALDSVIILLDELGLVLSTSKSNYCLFSKGQRRLFPILKANGQPLPRSDSVKYLGIWLDSNLRWGKHVKETVNKCSKFFNILKVLAGSTWGVHTKHLRRLYISLVRSRLDYGSFIYDCGAKKHTNKLDKIQNQALRITGGFIKSTPIHVMECELNIMPLFLRRQYLAYKFMLKSVSWSNNITVDMVLNLSELCQNRYWVSKKKPLLAETINDIKAFQVYSSHTLRMFSLDIWVSAIEVQENIKSDLVCVPCSKNSFEPNALLNNVIEELNTNYGGWHKFYTDGSKSALGQGVGYFYQNSNIKTGYRINSYVSIMTLELIAIFQAMSYANEQNLNKFVIFSDSKSALQHVARCASGIRGVSIAYDIINIIYKLNKNGIEFRLQWVPAHIGLKGNEEADGISKLAALEGNEFHFLPDYSDLIPKVKMKCNKFWKKYFNEKSETKGIWYKTIQHEPPRYLWFDDGKLSRSYVKLALRLRSGHYPSAKFAFLMKKNDSPNCVTCNKIEDVQHLLMDCVKNKTEREKLERENGLNRLDIGLIQTILSLPKSDLAKQLCGLAVTRNP
ncbi:hypothetical protein PYW07_002494 [Mythimna separata]|uniref:Uncharacterized protein n=1 Tax=Mythimna separata TaxID=271217 RepID=A0AAD8DUC8_MYTSE|nr:hypothetical protein PYW07_002494 [Mythimna separata]